MKNTWRENEEVELYMKIKIDFCLSKNRFSSFEKMLFKLLLKNVYSLKHLRELLFIFSNEVIANGIQNLVNNQIIFLDRNTKTLSLSESVYVLIEACKGRSYMLNLPEENKKEVLKMGYSIISHKKAKREIMKSIIANVDLSFLVESIDFVLVGD